MTNFNSKIKNKRILITNASSRSAYAALRNLTKYGAKCYIADKTSLGMSQFSKHKYKFYKYTCHYLCEKSFISDIKEIIKKEKIDFILPTHNETEVISRNKHKLPTCVKYLLPSVKHCELFNNKSSAYTYVSELSIPIPTRIPYGSIAELEHKLSEFRDKHFVVKLLMGNSSKGVFHTRGNNETVAKVKPLCFPVDQNYEVLMGTNADLSPLTSVGQFYKLTGTTGIQQVDVTSGAMTGVARVVVSTGVAPSGFGGTGSGSGLRQGLFKFVRVTNPWDGSLGV